MTRGWLDVRNRDSAARPSPVVEGREYRLRHPPGTRMTVRTGLSSVTLPVAPPA
ncbi:hypothetical protein [Streptomyces massasporeus]|uniref:hypothetical protein n=1 Tax=Streptomyces massasporeus TaxID=67324 RepID=UPI0033ED6ACA